MSKKYLFTSKRLGFRNWQPIDLNQMAALNADQEVMEFFPSTQSKKKTKEFIDRMQDLFARRKHCYFAVEKRETNQFIGFIGLGYQTFEAPFTPCVDIGWRLARKFWGNGYATEGARRCLQYAFEDLKLSEMNSIASVSNLRSTHVMEKIGMKKNMEFEHPKLIDYPHLNPCVLYRIKN